MKQFSSVTIVMPVRNEERYIARCLDTIIAQDYPKYRMELTIIDGMSEDRTREIVGEYSSRYPFIKFLDNPKKVQTVAMNIGIQEAKGDIIIRLDAHAEYSVDHVSRSVSWLRESGADCVGGTIITKPGGDTLTADAIAIALSHPFGVGNAFFRIGVKELRPVDTVPFGCYKKEVFERVGLFNEDLNRAEDNEFHLRVRNCGGLIILVPSISSVYYARPTLGGLAKQNFGNGFWVRIAKLPGSIRHLVPFLFVLSLITGLSFSLVYYPAIYLFASVLTLYFCINLFFSFKLSFGKGIKYFPSLVLTFATLHFSHGFGSLWGIIAANAIKIKGLF